MNILYFYVKRGGRVRASMRVCVCVYMPVRYTLSQGKARSFHPILKGVSDPKKIQKTPKLCFKRSFRFCQIGQIST